MSGFLLEIEDFPFGRCTLELQVRDHEKNWRTIYTTTITVFPLDFIGQLRLPNVQRVLVGRLRDRFAGGPPALKSEAGELAESRSVSPM